MSRAFSYVLLELGVLATVVAMTWARPEWRQMRTRWFVGRVAALFVLWCIVDYIAIGLNLWRFPPGGTLRWRILSLPPEEYLVFLLHTIMTYFLVCMLEQDAR